MRTTTLDRSILSRSVIAVASLAVGAVGLLAITSSTAANAATPNGITRDQVLAAAAGIRSGVAPTQAQQDAINAIATKSCGIDPSTTPLIYGRGAATAGDDADGVVLSAVIFTENSPVSCTVAAFATTDPAFQLSGNVTVNRESFIPPTPSTTLFTGPLSGDVYVTPAIKQPGPGTATATASGNATRTTTSTTVVKQRVTKSKAQKKAAKKKYEKRLSSAKKSYKKALSKAGGSKSKKSAAKKAYKAKRASAKAKYKKSIRGFKLVRKSVSTTENRPFSVTATESTPQFNTTSTPSIPVPNLP